MATPAINGIPIHPLTFKPEFIDAYELGTKNTLLDGGLTLNGDVFFYNYRAIRFPRSWTARRSTTISTPP